MFKRITVIALLVAALGFVVLEVGGYTDTPIVPPGLVIIAAALAFVAFASSPRAGLAGSVAGVFNLVAMFVVGADERLTQPGEPVAFLASWVMALSLLTASVTGAVTERSLEAVRRRSRGPRR